MAENKEVKEDKKENPLAGLLAELAKEMEKTKDWQFGDKIQFPLTVKNVFLRGRMGVSDWHGNRTGSFVSIRPVNDEKTYLGLYIGDIPMGIDQAYDPTNQDLHLSVSANPAIFVFDLNKVVMGAESWWGEIENEDQLRKITDNDIQNIWYVKALKWMQEQEKNAKS